MKEFGFGMGWDGMIGYEKQSGKGRVVVVVRGAVGGSQSQCFELVG